MGVGGVLLGPPCESYGMLLMMIKGECACSCGRHGIPKHDHDQSTCPCYLHGTCCCTSPKPVTWGGLGGMHCECCGSEAEKIRRHEGGEHPSRSSVPSSSEKEGQKHSRAPTIQALSVQSM